MNARVDGLAAGLTVPTPWYPTPYDRMAGSFVAEYARLAVRVAPPVHVVHAQEWPGGRPGDPALPGLRRAFDDALDRLSPGGRHAGGLAVTGAAGPLTRVPVFTVGGAGTAERAEAMVRDVRRAIGEFATPLVHGHVGYWGGLLAARLADPGAAVFATEHSTGLRAVLQDPAGRDQYAEVLQRCRRVFCVSGLLRDQLLAELPGFADRIEVLPNPVEFAGVPRRATPPQRLDRWVFVGGLIERKGVERLVRAFAVVARERPQVSLTMFGDGPLRDRLVEIARDAGVADRLHLPGVVRHGEVLARLPAFDLLLAPSTYETFHLAVVEGVAAGLPVIVTRSGGPQEALAGVESRVGEFVDVEESPDAIVEAHRRLSAAIDTLDLEGAAKELDARFGPEAIAARLAAAYGVPPPPPRAAPPRAAPPRAAPVDPERIVIVAVSSARRYSVEAELAAARRLAVPTVVVTADPQVTALASGLTLVGPGAVDEVAPPLPDPAGQASPSGPGPLASGGVRQFVGGLRRQAGGLRRAVAGRPTAVPPRAARLSPADVRGATVVAIDCRSLALAVRLAAADPAARLVVELDRGGALQPPPDSRDESE